MYRQHTVGVVVPAYNEEGFVGDVLRTMPEYVDRIYAVDDCSTDGTWDEIRQTAEEINGAAEESVAAVRADEQPVTATDGGPAFDRRVVPIQHETNRGVGGAIKTGYLEALEDKIDITAVMGGDGQMDPDILSRFLDPIVEGKADYTKGNRLVDKEYRDGMSRWRFFGNSVLTFLTKIASGYWKMMDPQNGYTAISQRALENVGIEEMYEYYGYCNDLLVKLNARGMRIADVPMPAVYGDEESSIDYPSYIWNVSGMLLRNFCWRLKARYLVLDFHPLALFYLLGTAICGVGVLGIAWSLYAWMTLAAPLFVRGSVSALLFVTGCLFVFFAMLFDMQANESMEV
ncbi:glycosyl transferase family 2 [Haloterrigena turkmenica DSM 5511]|uniref:Glycosyl transferase family 2 n=1 Tax=Haloterrigena turkmenica (strain ATCC 51198 / DSM 5511 / JCM 9101 / NCIMB 13204 / VKM B-1734 / 4k) TaxID=543526 RepID=D2RVU3_HALTV|nr:glycosyltransferase family 2 protein [Haloterrigena turkmenica]ADB61372.1 glycosyl transferase family 2 [Haloterrigena turkmenica DSM 5511]